VVPEHEFSLLNFEPMIAGSRKMAVAGENAAEFEAADIYSYPKGFEYSSISCPFLPPKNPQEKVKNGFSR
jgi:hypothetical protein